MKYNKIYHIDCIEGMKLLRDESVDLTITSPPYGTIRLYDSFSVDFENTAKQLYRVTRPGGIVVWVVGDQTIEGSESGESFREALYFKNECGFNLYDTMIYRKNGCPNPPSNRYCQVFEYMFILSKGKPKTVKLLKDRPNKWNGTTRSKYNSRQQDGSIVEKKNVKPTQPYGIRLNIWRYDVGFQHTTKDKIAKKHPALMPEKLAEDHILSWSNPGDLVLDPFAGGGTTCKMAKIFGRRYIGFEISKNYCSIARQRVNESTSLNDERNRGFCNLFSKNKLMEKGGKNIRNSNGYVN